ncbi:MAG: MBL fold metallo-hydrolase [Candidatus Kariarchaeaceae archaeon]|jgi:glyoxylase-like metal-dependent hydrolase (beta-lactamase superfamily II)/rhodanese-related sulfurtransferase
MKVDKYYLDCLSHASYILSSNGEAAVVDPQRDVDHYLEYLKEQKLELKYILETHLHADFVSGHLELAKRTNAKIVFGEKAGVTFDHIAVNERTVLEMGNLKIITLETPGHTPESVCYLIQDQSNSKKPGIVFTGDTLFAGDVGRPDLMDDTITADVLGGMLYDSLHDKLLQLPENTKVFPAHGAGSACGRELMDVEYTTIRQEKESNYALQPMTKEEFIKEVTTNQPLPPKYFAESAKLNQNGLISVDEVLSAYRPLNLEEFETLRSDPDNIVLDVREPDEFATSHIPGSYNIGLDGRYAEWVGSIIDASKKILIVANTEREREAALRCLRVGIDNVEGYLVNGFKEWEQNNRPLSSFQRHTPSEFKTLVDDPSSRLILDIRRNSEYNISHVPNAIHIPLNRLQERISELDPQKQIVVYCAGGYRSVIGSSILLKNKFNKVSDLQGGFDAFLDFQHQN